MTGTPKIIVLSEQLRGQSFELTEDRYEIGRTDERDITVPDATVSSHHCTLVRIDDGVYSVVDHGSTNGTRVNGVRLEPEQEQQLLNSDILQVGGVEMLLDCEGTPQAGSATTQTVINLEETHTGEMPVSEMRNFSPFGSKRGKVAGGNRKSVVVIGSIIGLLLLGAVVAVVVLAMQLF